MVSIPSFRKAALAFNDVVEQPHFEKTSFRIRGKIFATMDVANKQASLKLPPNEQSVYGLMKPVFASPATGAWGKQGWTRFDLAKVPAPVMREALKTAYETVAPVMKATKPVRKAAVRKEKAEMIQTLHPDKTKTNKRILLEKYNFIKTHLLAVLKKAELTHTDLMEALYQRVKDEFEGGVQWYGETVKLDLEARRVIERTGARPERYRIKGQG
jgi:hypothetical protein